MVELTDKKYVREIEAGAHRIEVRYVPPFLRLLRTSGLDDSVVLTPGQVDSMKRLSGEGGGIMFVFRLAPKDSASRPGFANDVVYGGLSGKVGYQSTQEDYLFGLKEKIWMEVDGRKIPLSTYQMENSFGITKSRNFVLLFPGRVGAKNATRSIAVVLDDIVPGLARKKLTWQLPIGSHDETI